MKWYLAKLVYRILCGDGNHTAQFDEQLRLINAQDELHAFQKARSLGHREQDNFLNAVNKPVIWKFIGTGTVAPGTANVVPNVRKPYQSDARFHIYRFADAQLLWAEALNRAGDKTNAIARINSVRGANGTGMPAPTVTVNSSTEDIEDYILRERGLELGFEGDRWYDIMRIARRRGNQYLVDRVKKRAPVSEHAYLQATLIDQKNWYLPYNAEEKRLNPNLK